MGKDGGKGSFQAALRLHYERARDSSSCSNGCLLVTTELRDASDHSDENFQISETLLEDSFKEFCIILIQEFGQVYLNQCPTNEEIK